MFADYLVRHGVRLGIVRKLLATGGLLGPAAAFAILVLVPQPSSVLATLLSTIAVSLLGCGDSGYWAAYVDASPRYAGVLLGMGNTIANFAGILTGLTTGWILEAHKVDDDGVNINSAGWTAVFMLAVAVNVGGWLTFVCFYSNEGSVLFD